MMLKCCSCNEVHFSEVLVRHTIFACQSSFHHSMISVFPTDSNVSSGAFDLLVLKEKYC